MKNLYIAIIAIFSMGWANSIQASEIEQIINFSCVGTLKRLQIITGDRKENPKIVARLCDLTDKEGFLQTATEYHHIKLYKITQNEDGTYQLTFGYNPGKTRKAFDKKKIEPLIPKDAPENLKKIDDYWGSKYDLVIIKTQPIVTKKAS